MTDDELDTMERDAGKCGECATSSDPALADLNAGYGVLCASHVRALVAEVRRLNQLYGAASMNGDVIDWLYTWLRDLSSPASQCVLGIFLRRAGYEDADELLKFTAPKSTSNDARERHAADGFVTPPAGTH